MALFRNLPLRRKLTLFILLVTSLALVLAILAMISYEIFTFKERAISNLATLAEMISVSTSVTLDFPDPKTAQETLDTLSREQQILCACIYDKEGAIFASYVRPDLENYQFPQPQPESERFEGRDLILFRRIRSQGDVVGTVYLRYDAVAAYARLPHYLAILVGVFLGLLGLAWVFSTVLQRIISAPILRLASAAQLLTDRKHEGVRVVKESNDEIGQLTDAFNQMIETLAAREKALSEANAGLARELVERKRVEEALRRSEAKLRRYADELEVRVDERTSNLKETIRSLEGVLYHVAHDLRAPLRAMQGFITLLLHQSAGQLDATGKDYASKVSTAAIRMDKLIQDLLEYGRLGHMELPCQEIDVAPHVASVVAEASEIIRARRAKVQVTEPLFRVWANPKVLDQVLRNLLSNALKFVASGVTPQVHIRAEASQEKVRIWVEDNGIGIPAEYQERVFGVFERLHGPEEYPGTGIGLAIVHKGVERMGGKVGIESQVGTGSRFWVDVPTPPTDL